MKLVIAARRGSGGEDMISRMVSSQIDGRYLSDFEAESICIQVLVGGLDTVANMIGFIMSYLAKDTKLRQAIAAVPGPDRYRAGGIPPPVPCNFLEPRSARGYRVRRCAA